MINLHNAVHFMGDYYPIFYYSFAFALWFGLSWLVVEITINRKLKKSKGNQCD